MEAVLYSLLGLSIIPGIIIYSVWKATRPLFTKEDLDFSDEAMDEWIRKNDPDVYKQLKDLEEWRRKHVYKDS